MDSVWRTGPVVNGCAPIGEGTPSPIGEAAWAPEREIKIRPSRTRARGTARRRPRVGNTWATAWARLRRRRQPARARREPGQAVVVSWAWPEAGARASCAGERPESEGRGLAWSAGRRRVAARRGPRGGRRLPPPGRGEERRQDPHAGPWPWPCRAVNRGGARRGRAVAVNRDGARRGRGPGLGLLGAVRRLTATALAPGSARAGKRAGRPPGRRSGVQVRLSWPGQRGEISGRGLPAAAGIAPRPGGESRARQVSAAAQRGRDRGVSWPWPWSWPWSLSCPSPVPVDGPPAKRRATLRGQGGHLRPRARPAPGAVQGDRALADGPLRRAVAPRGQRGPAACPPQRRNRGGPGAKRRGRGKRGRVGGAALSLQSP